MICTGGFFVRFAIDMDNSEIVSLNFGRVIGVIYTHLSAFYGLWLIFTSAQIYTTFFAFLLAILSIIGVTVGSHRLWSHRSYKAKFPLRLLLAFFQTIGYQHSILEWATRHRIHHIYTDTNSDPHNATRGFFFSHIGWVLSKKHPDYAYKEDSYDISDLIADPIVRFQDKYYYSLLMPLLCFILPTLLPVIVWNETWINAWHVPTILRFVIVMQISLLANSIAHRYGTKPYDKRQSPVENLAISALTLGEGWHNYHHSFPWDYKASEFGSHFLNPSTFCINCFQKIGWAYDLRYATDDMIKYRCLRTGDGSHFKWGDNGK